MLFIYIYVAFFYTNSIINVIMNVGLYKLEFYRILYNLNRIKRRIQKQYKCEGYIGYEYITSSNLDLVERGVSV